MVAEVYRELLLGCGRSREKRLCPPGAGEKFKGLLTLDMVESARPDFIGDLNHTPWNVGLVSTAAHYAKITRPCAAIGGGVNGSEFMDDAFDEIHAYEVLEHLRSQGDYKGFFADFSEIWRVLKPGGYLCATCPSRFTGWLWGDPGHTRAIMPESLTFLDQSEYVKQFDNSGRPSSMSDYRNVYRADFKCVDQATNRDQFMFILQAVKPSRWVDSLAR
jgi:SAM-dependent methyltransferase